MIPTLYDPPESLGAEFDMHGVRCALRPRAERPMWLRIVLGGGSLVVGVSASFALAIGLYSWLMLGSFLGMYVTVGSLPVIAVLLGFAVVDSAEQLDQFEMRLGEGWLVLRFADQGSEIRMDLNGVVSCEVVSRDLLLENVAGEQALVPMGGHSKDELLWVASAVNLAIRDAQSGDLPAPASLLDMIPT